MKKNPLIIIFCLVLTFITGYSINVFIVKEKKPESNWLDPTQAPFNAKGDGKTDDTKAIQSAIDYAHAHGIDTLKFPSGKFLFLHDIDLKEGVSLIGNAPQSDSTNRGEKKVQLHGTVLVSRGASILVRQSTVVDGFTIYYDQQKYSLSPDSSTPDGIENFVEYEPTFKIKTHRGSFTIQNIVYIGGSTILQALGYPNQFDKMRLKNIVGCPTKVAFDIAETWDISFVDTILINPSSLMNFVDGSIDPGGKRLSNKIAKNLVVFKLGKVDDMFFDNIFAYGVKDMFYLYKGEVAPNRPEQLATASFTANNISADCVNTLVHIESPGNLFGIKINNGFYTALQQRPVINGKLSNRKPAIIRMSGKDVSNTKVLLSNIVTFGKTSSNIYDTNSTQYLFQFENTGDNNTILVSNSALRDYEDLTLGENSTNKVSFSNVQTKNGSIMSSNP
ncbi:glycosyl hydrolase family 28-related protein [Priestia megaterium]